MIDTMFKKITPMLYLKLNMVGR